VQKTPRIVGGFNDESGKIAKTLYESIIDASIMQVSTLDTAELVKLVENTQRDLNIAYINEIALICEKIGVDVKEIIAACKTKWNFYPAMPGPGVGGHCLPNNPYYILKRAEEKGFHPRLIMLGRQVNDSMQYHVVDLIADALNELGKPIKGTKIALLGVSYKANVDDVRQAPSRVIAEELRKKGANLVITDPHVNEVNMKKVHDKVVSLEEALKCECLVFLCGHDEYKKLDLTKTNAKAVVDAVFLFDGFEKGVYKRVGKGK
jgi:nucleotide sugar dehydrogenase